MTVLKVYALSDYINVSNDVLKSLFHSMYYSSEYINNNKLVIMDPFTMLNNLYVLTIKNSIYRVDTETQKG